jgi:hypothetical protein
VQCRRDAKERLGEHVAIVSFTAPGIDAIGQPLAVRIEWSSRARLIAARIEPAPSLVEPHRV